MGFHLKSVVRFCPVFQSQIHCAWTQIRATDSNLTNLSIFFALFVHDFSRMNFFCKISDFFLFIDIKITFVLTVCKNIFSKLSASKLVQNHSFLAGIYNFAIVKSLKFFKKLGFIRQILQCLKNLLINLLCGIVISQTFSHWY